MHIAHVHGILYRFGAFFIASIFSFSFLTPSVFALGISPPSVDAPNVLRGGAPQEKSIRLGRGPGEEGDLYIDISVRGEYASYIKFEPTFMIPAAQNGADYFFSIDPGNASSGTYQVPMTFSLAAQAPDAQGDGQSGASFAVVTGATAMINFTVSGEQVVGYSFLSLSVNDTEVDDGEFVTFSITNTGNVDWKPTRIELAFIDKMNNAETVSSVIESADIDLIGPGENSQQTVHVPELLVEGSYTLSAVFFDDQNNKVGELTSQPFSVFTNGALVQDAQLLSVSATKDSYAPEEKIPLKALVKNMGQVPLEGVLMTEIYRDGVYFDLVRGEGMTLHIGEEAELTQILPALEAGKYTFASYVKFANRKTSSIETSVRVLNDGILGFINTPLGIGIFAGVILFSVAGVVLWRRKKMNRVSSPATAPTRILTDSSPVESVPNIPSDPSSL